MPKRLCSCGKPALKRRTICAACSQRRYRAAHPFEAAYQAHKDNCKRRGKITLLTFEQFKKFATETEYWHRKGKKSTSLHIDRIEETGVYELSNIQPLENAANVRKFRKFKQRTEKGVEFEAITVKPVTKDGCPF